MYIYKQFPTTHRKLRIRKYYRPHRPVLQDDVVRQAEVAIVAIQIGSGLRDSGIGYVQFFHNQYNLFAGRRIGAVRISRMDFIRENSRSAFRA